MSQSTTEEKTAPNIPETITLNGVSYSVKETPELVKLIQDVAKVEKTKLYTQFESLKRQINEMAATKIEQPSAPLGNAQQMEKLKSDLMLELLPALKGVVQEVVQPVLDTTRNNELAELTAYREQLLRDNDSICIPELVKGNTKDELLASLNESIRLRAAYPSPGNTVERVTDPLIVKQEREMQQVHTPPRIPSFQPVEVTAGDGVKSMSQEEFVANRDRLLHELTTTFGAGN